MKTKLRTLEALYSYVIFFFGQNRFYRRNGDEQMKKKTFYYIVYGRLMCISKYIVLEPTRSIPLFFFFILNFLLHRSHEDNCRIEYDY